MMLSRRIFAALCMLCACALPAHAQKTKAAIITEIPVLCPSNQLIGSCTVTNAQLLWSDIVNSVMPTAPVTSGNLACFNGTTGLLQDCGVAPSTAGIIIGTTSITSGTTTRVLYDNAGKVGEYTTVPPANGGTGSANATNSANDVLASNGTNGNFLHTALLTVLDNVCTLSPSSCSFVFGYQNVIWYGAKCDGSTDDSTALQAAITAQPASGNIGGVILSPANAICLFATPLSFVGKSYITVKGANSGIASTGTSSIWIYTGGAATRAINALNTSGIVFDGMMLGWNNSAFAGILLDFGSSSPGSTVTPYPRVTRSAFSPFGSGSTTAVTCVNVSEAIEFTIDQTGFVSCKIAIHGENVLGQSTVGLISHNQFFNSAQVPIQQCGEAWRISSNTFEHLQSGLIGAFSNSSTLPCKGITFDNNWIGDGTANGGTAIDIYAQGLSIRGGRISGFSSTSNVAIGLEAVTGFSIEGVQFDNLSIAVSAASGTPNGGIICGNAYASASVTTFISSGMGTSVFSTSCNASF